MDVVNKRLLFSFTVILVLATIIGVMGIIPVDFYPSRDFKTLSLIAVLIVSLIVGIALSISTINKIGHMYKDIDAKEHAMTQIL